MEKRFFYYYLCLISSPSLCITNRKTGMNCGADGSESEQCRNVEMPWTLIGDLEGKTQDTNRISPVLHLTLCHQTFSNICIVLCMCSFLFCFFVYIFFLCGDHLDSMAQISFYSVKSASSFTHHRLT